MNIYVLQVIGGKEYKIAAYLNNKGIPAFIPREAAIIRKGGKWHEQERLLFPGYVFIELCEYSAESYYTAKTVEGIVRFFKKPLALAEAERIGWLRNNGEVIAPSEIEFDGLRFNVVSGILKDNECRILKLDRHKRKAYVAITLSGEEKIVRLSVNIKRADYVGQG